MKIESLAAQVPTAESIRAAEGPAARRLKLDSEIRQQSGDSGSKEARAAGQKQEDDRMAPEEVLDRIEEISEDGVYSVRFEKNEDLNRLVVKLVDRKTDEVVRQIPPEEILGVKAKLREYAGNIVNEAY